ncbi:MAG: arginine deiminase family protein [Candidatus Heimdallarchaeota archaeon]|nr:arginine deiminase family protein [Candidatus Heimdallarchaeota archaeon]MDH5644812.1 arginine deiminase family protein [Candidatus Heimdallarchaeota archaeon]
MKYEKALVRPPTKSLLNCISSHPNIKYLNFEKALDQHKSYRSILSELGLELIILDEIDLPDSCFVEDNAVIFNNKVILTRMGAVSRREEVESVGDVLAEFFDIQRIQPSGTIEGGDIIHLRDNLIIGNSQRTNIEGINQINTLLDIQSLVIKDPEIIHLKSYITNITDDLFISTKKYSTTSFLHNKTILVVSEKEKAAANSLTIGETVILPQDSEEIGKKIKDYGFDIVQINLSEFQLCEGAITCLSLLF